MKDLFFSECRRFRNAALIFAAVHLVLQLFVNRMFDLLQLTYEPHMVLLAVYMLAGLAFALVQFGSYRQGSRWLWLLHRPMPRIAIFGAIMLASAVLIMFAVGLPALVTVAVTDMLSSQVVDTRHYLMVLHLVLLTAMAWLVGSYVILHGRRSAIVVLVLPFLLLAHLASGYVMLLPALLCLALLVFIAYGTFKPDRAAPPAGSALAATAAPLQIGFYFAMVWAGSILYQNAMILAGVHPLNRPVPPVGGYTESTRAESIDVFKKGLAYSTDPQAAQWRRQVALLDIANFQPGADQYPVRHQLSNLRSLGFIDKTSNTEWTFSHDDMLFHGRDIYTMQARGVAGLEGIGDSTPLPAVPVVSDDGSVLMPQQMRARDPATGKLNLLAQVKAPETLARAPKQAGSLLYVITNQRLIAYDKPDGDVAAAPLRERFSIGLPEPLSHLDRIDIADLLDARLISISYGRGMTRGSGEAHQIIMLVDQNGASRQVARRQLAHDFPALFEHHDWWVSPALHGLIALPEALLAKGMILDHGKTRYTNELEEARPAAAWIAAIVAALLSALGAWWWLRHTRAGARRKAIWIVNCLLIGPPALACLAVMERRESAAASETTTHTMPLAA